MSGKVKHDPRYLFDCGNCKFNWCCGPECHCVLKKNSYSLPPLGRMMEVAAARRAAGFEPAAREILRDLGVPKANLVVWEGAYLDEEGVE